MLTVDQLRVLHVGPLDLTVADRRIAVLTGPSGSGKSLLLRAIADLIPSHGRVSVDAIERDEIPAPQWRRRVGLLLPESGWWTDRVGDHFPDRDGMRETAAGLIRNLGFDSDVFPWDVTRLSTGERQRLALARLLMLEPRVLLLDEPTASLDPVGVERVESVVARYRQRTSAPVVWVSHDPAQIARVADEVVRLDANGAPTPWQGVPTPTNGAPTPWQGVPTPTNGAPTPDEGAPTPDEGGV